MVEGIHFDRRYFRPAELGHRALAASLSDIAAMGGNPLYYGISLGLTGAESVEAVEALYDGFFALAAPLGVELLGGDTVRSPQALLIDAVAIGLAEAGRAVYRGGARPGDQLFVTGALGMSAWGLQLLQSGTFQREHPAVQAHLRPVPRVAAGRQLNLWGVTAMTDVTDGLAAELLALSAAGGVGLRVMAEQIPTPPGLPSRQGLELALYGGEDFELLFAVPSSLAPSLSDRLGELGLKAGWIGEVRPQAEGLTLVGAPDGFRWEGGAYDHFRRGD